MTKLLSSSAIALAFVASPNAALADLKVVASFSILGDIVEHIGGDSVAVTTLVGADQDAHIYIPNVSDARSVARADVVFLNGLGFETWADDLVAGSGTSATVVSVAEDLPLELHGD
ncbi:MAG: metal ABC transporter substrate-binding protein, partial [Alphaproteobacteria bacterium]